MRILKDPLIHFLVAGSLIFAAYSFSQSAERAGAGQRIVIDGPTQEWLHGNFRKQFRRLPTRMEMGALIRVHIEHEVKYRHALSMGLDDRDVIVRRRMMQKFDFLFGDAAAGGLPQDGALRDWYHANAEDFMTPATISFTHLWFSPDTRAESANSRASAALEDLRVNRKPESDAFPFEVRFDEATRAEVRNVLGPEFSQAVFEAPMAVWSGPVQSGLGSHLVRVSDKTSSELPLFEGIQDAVLERWREDESERILAELVASLKAQFAIELDEESLAQFEYAPDNEGDRR